MEKAIREAGLNLNPISDGKNLKVPIPKPTKEHRDNMVKIANKAAEQAKTRIRSVRHDGMKDLKKDLKLGLSEDKVKKLEKSVSWNWKLLFNPLILYSSANAISFHHLGSNIHW